MQISYFHKIVKKLSKKRGKVLTVSDLKKIIQLVLSDEYAENKAYKYIYRLKMKGYLLGLKKNLFFVKKPEEDLHYVEVIDQHYRKILSMYCKEYFTPSEFYIGGIKALEIHLANFSVPQSIDIINGTKKSNQIVVTDHDVCFKTYYHGGKNLYPIFKKMANSITIQGVSFRVADIEIALLESLYSLSPRQGQYNMEIVKKIFQRYKQYICTEKFIYVLREGKHHASMNRLLQIVGSYNKKIATEYSEIIKKYSFVID